MFDPTQASVGGEQGGIERVVPERLKPVEFPKGYRGSVAQALLGLILLCGAYLLTVVGGVVIVFKLFAYAIVDQRLVEHPDGKLFLLLLGAICFSVVLFFMVSPLLQRSKMNPRYVPITESDQEQFFVFLKRLCRALDAPVPDEVALDSAAEVSAQKIRRSQGRRRLQLVIGTTLIQRLSVLQLAAMLTPELVRFRPRDGARWGEVAESLRRFFVLLAYDTKSADFLNHRRRQNHAIGSVFYSLLILPEKAARRICRMFAWLGNAACGRLTRLLQDDGDRWTARLIGSDRFTELLRETTMLEYAFDRALDSMTQYAEDEPLPVDFAVYSSGFRSAVNREFERHIWDTMTAEKTRWFHNWSTCRDRIAKVGAFAPASSPAEGAPAYELFHDWTGYSRKATRAHYSRVLGEAILQEHLAGGKSDEDEDREIRLAHRRCFAGARPWFSPLRLGGLFDYVAAEMGKANVDLTDAARRQIEAQRAIMTREAERIEEARLAATDGLGRWLRFSCAEHLYRVGATSVLQENQLPTDPASLRGDREAAIRDLQNATQAQAAFEHASAFRLALALAGPGGGKMIELRDQAKPSVAFLRALETESECIRSILVEHSILQTIVNLGDFPLSNEYEAYRNQLTDRLKGRLQQLYYNFEQVPFAVDDKKRVSASSRLLQIPESSTESILSNASTFLERLPDAVFLTLGRLALIAEQIETEMGLEPLDLTPPDSEGEVRPKPEA